MDDHVGPREQHFPVTAQQPVGMVRVDMGQEHGVDIGGRVTGGHQVLGQKAHRIDGGRAAAAVDHDGAAADLDHEGVDGQPRRAGTKGVAHGGLHPFTRRAAKDFERDIQKTVVDDGDQRVADRPSVDAGHLLCVQISQMNLRANQAPNRGRPRFGRTSPGSDAQSLTSTHCLPRASYFTSVSWAGADRDVVFSARSRDRR